MAYLGSVAESAPLIRKWMTGDAIADPFIFEANRKPLLEKLCGKVAINEASLYGSDGRGRRNGASQDWKTNIKQPEDLLVTTRANFLQHKLLKGQQHLDWKKATGPAASTDEALRLLHAKLAVRLVSAAGQGADGWLTALPVTPALTIPNAPMLVRLRRLLGLPPPFDRPPNCACGKSLAGDDDLDHIIITCHTHRYRVHNAILSTLPDIIRSTGKSVDREVMGRNLFSACNDDKRLDLVIYSDTSLPPIVGDVTVVHPGLAQLVSYAKSHGASAGKAIEIAIKRKQDKYGALCQDAHMPLHVYALEHFGRMSPQLISQLKKCGGAEAHAESWSSDVRRSWATPDRFSFYKQLISCCLQRALGLKELNTIKRARYCVDFRGSVIDLVKWYQAYDLD
jgi:hypothetical protein